MIASASLRRGAHRLFRFADITALAWLVLLVCIAGTLATWHFTQREADANATLRFEHEADDAREAIERRIEAYVNLLRGGAAFFNAVGTVSGEQWRRYVAQMEIETHWPGIGGMGYVQRLAPTGEGNASVPHGRSLFFEPSAAGNAQVAALDPFSDPTRRAAMELARDTGGPVVSGRVPLLLTPHGQDDVAGFLIVVPVYAPGAAPESVEQRRDALHGFVYGVFYISELMKGVLGESSERVDLRVFDSASTVPEALIYDSQTSFGAASPRRTELMPIRLPGRNWRLEIDAQPSFEGSLKSGVSTAVALGGALVSLLAFALVIMLVRNRASTAQLSKLSLALEQSPESVVITDTRAVIEYVNEAFVRTTGYSRDEVLGRNPGILHSGKTPPATYAGLWAALRQGLMWKGEFYNRMKDGSDYVEWAIITPLRQRDGQITHYIAIKENITEKKRMSEELDFHRQHLEEQVVLRTGDLIAARQQADAASEAKSRFLASMSHEIRTPLNAVLGFAYLCLNLDLGDRQRGYVEKIRSAADSLLGVVNDILDFSKADAGKLQIESIPFVLSEVLQKVASLFQMATRRKGVELVVGTLPGVPDSLVGDPLRLGQVLINLVGNAVKFTEHGEIHLTVEPLSSGSQTLTLRFVVRDTGTGMSPPQQALLFKPFSQADSSITRKYGGTGLGLALCKQLVACMDGEIGVESEAGVGSCFSFSARFGRATGALLAATAEHSPLAGKMVLIVEDSQAMRSLLSHNVTTFGCQVAAVDRGEAVLSTLRSGARVDLILMDWHMPGLDGLTTARYIRSTGNTVPVVLISGDEVELARAAANAMGVRIDAFLCKPVSTATLRQAMLDALGQPVAPPPRVAGPAPPPRLHGKRILLVDDNDFNRQIGRELVELTGATVVTADDGAQAVAAVADGAFDLVLMDLQMPVLDGHSAARLIRERWPELTIIALTAHAMPEEQARVFASGMNALLTKPIEPELLYAALAHWLGSGQRAMAEDQPTPATAGEVVADAAPGTFDLATALSRVGGDRAMLDRFLRLFRERNATIVDDIGAALAANDGDTARRLAHALKGGAGTVGLLGLQAAALGLEQTLGQTLDPALEANDRATGYAQLQAAWQQAMETLANLLAGG